MADFRKAATEAVLSGLEEDVIISAVKEIYKKERGGSND